MQFSRLRRVAVLSCVRYSVVIIKNFDTGFAIHYIMKKILNIVLISIFIGLSTQQDEKNITSCTDYDRIDVECFTSKVMERLCNGTYVNVINCENSIINLYDESKEDYDDDNKTDIDIGNRYNTPTSAELVALGVLSLGVDIFRKTASESSAKIQVISPLSIAGATSLMQLGAKGETLSELRQINGQIKEGENVLQSKDFHENFGLLLDEIKAEKYNRDEHKVTVANGIFAQKKLVIRPEYRNAAVKVYQSHIQNLDFQNESESSTKVINDWVNTTTNGKIGKIVNAVEPETQVVIVSTLYFKALWDPDLGVQAVVPELFYPNGDEGSSVEVDMLLIDGGKYLYHKSKLLDCRMIGLNYDNGTSTMFIILPNKSTKKKLLDLQSRLKAEDLEEMMSKTKNKSATIILPKFHVEQSTDIQTALKDLGLNTLFNAESDLSLIKAKKRGRPNPQSDELTTREALHALESITTTANPHIYVDRIVHKVVLSVDEFGTEGGAATGGIVNKQGSSILFVATSPFLFLIRHNPTNLTLFYGAVFEPSFNK